ncbi:hypothetical protein VITFI_CDS1693 [Vitreoscilla filiformis]|uniref:Uncharacterized protein n=1 Tax=Vitreoscilla filiformis TaxID=63 RepID=A0A221KEN1_VITFI|nr:hypothetical protein VITFI_CDS1693 [Vitreoscilla filiformis]
MNSGAPTPAASAAVAQANGFGDGDQAISRSPVVIHLVVPAAVCGPA